MSNVVSINRNRRKQPVFPVIGNGAKETAKHLSVVPAPPADDLSPALQELDTLSNTYLLNKLQLQHKRERMERELAAQEFDNKLALENAAYAALIAGVPEEEIYELDELVAQALEDAIRKVQAQA